MLPKRMSSNASTVEKSLAPWGHRTLGRDSWWGLNSKSTGLPCLGSGAPGGTFRRGGVIDGLVASRLRFTHSGARKLIVGGTARHVAASFHGSGVGRPFVVVPR